MLQIPRKHSIILHMFSDENVIVVAVNKCYCSFSKC